MKKILLGSVVALALTGSVILSAQTMNITKGWQILGATQNIADMTVFKSDCVSAVFTYANDSVGYKVYQPTGFSNQISSLNAGEGFWIKGLQSCTVDTSGQSTATPPPPPSTTTTTTTTNTTTTSGTTDTTSTDTASSNRALYDQVCAACHSMSKLGVSVSDISNAISRNRGGMGSLSYLTSAQLQAISAAR